MNFFKKLLPSKPKRKIKAVQHNFDGEDAFWDEVMDKNLAMFVLDDDAQNAMSFRPGEMTKWS